LEGEPRAFNEGSLDPPMVPSMVPNRHTPGNSSRSKSQRPNIAYKVQKGMRDNQAFNDTIWGFAKPIFIVMICTEGIFLLEDQAINTERETEILNECAREAYERAVTKYLDFNTERGRTGRRNTAAKFWLSIHEDSSIEACKSQVCDIFNILCVFFGLITLKLIPALSEAITKSLAKVRIMVAGQHGFPGDQMQVRCKVEEILSLAIFEDPFLEEILYEIFLAEGNAWSESPVQYFQLGYTLEMYAFAIYLVRISDLFGVVLYLKFLPESLFPTRVENGEAYHRYQTKFQR
jgi:hypothetical protein